MTIYKAIIFNAITECLAKGDWHKKHLLMVLAKDKALVLNVRAEKEFVAYLAGKGIRPRRSEHSYWCDDMKRYTMPELKAA